LQFRPILLTINLFLHRNNRKSREERGVSCPSARCKNLISAHDIGLIPSGLETCSELMQRKENYFFVSFSLLLYLIFVANTLENWISLFVYFYFSFLPFVVRNNLLRGVACDGIWETHLQRPISTRCQQYEGECKYKRDPSILFIASLCQPKASALLL
jgi:hypothetical protein